MKVMMKVFLIDVVNKQNKCCYYFIIIMIEICGRQSECKDDLFL